MVGSNHGHSKPTRVGGGFFMGSWRPGFRRDAPLWFTILVFGFFLALLIVCLVSTAFSGTASCASFGHPQRLSRMLSERRA